MSGSVSLINGHIDPDKKKMTYEDVKRIRENPTAEDVDNKELHKLIDEAIEKQIPKKYIRENIKGFETPVIKCPDCLSLIGRVAVLEIGEVVMVSRFCSNCGKAIDRGDTE